jgi:parallel beta-helix repeat protein
VTFASAAQATPVACSETALVAAINLANTTPAADTLNLASDCTYDISSPHGSAANGQEALPVITTPIEMIGPATIRRAGLGLFRIAEVSNTGNLTLTTGVVLANGSAVGHGGGILNFGAVTLTNSTLRNNAATGNGGGLANADTAGGTAPAATFTRSPVVDNTALLSGGGIFNGLRGTLTSTGLPMLVGGNTATVNGGGIAAVNSTATTLTGTTVTGNVGVLGGGVYRSGLLVNGAMTTTASPISGNLVNNCVGSSPAVPNCTS